MARKDTKSPNPKAQKKTAPRRSSRTAEPAVFPEIPKWLPAALFGALTIVLFRDFIFGDAMLFGHDTNGLGYVARAFYADALTRLGDFPGWAPQILGGTPFLEALSAGDSLYPPSALLLLIMDPHRALGWKLVLHVLAAGFFMFGWVRSIGASRAAALLGGAGYMLAPFFVTLVFPGHDGKMFVTALAPLLFWAVERHFQAPKIRSFAAISLVVGLVILTTHFQMAYFLFLATGCFAFYRAIESARGPGEGVGHADGAAGGGTATVQEGASSGASSGASTGRASGSGASTGGIGLTPAALRFGLFLAASIAGAGIAGVQFFPAYQYVTADSRRVATTREAEGETSKEWSASWSLHPEEAVSLVVPEFVGGSVQQSGGWTEGTYWGRNFFKFNHEYLGLVLVILAGVSFAGGSRKGLRWFLAVMGALAALFAMGANTPVWHVAYALIPGVSLFRAVSQVIFLTGFAVATLAALGFDRVLATAGQGDADAAEKVQKVLWGFTAALGLFLALAASGVLTSVWTSTIYAGIAPERLQVLELLRPSIVQGAGIAFFFAAAVAGLFWAARSHYLAPVGLAAGLIFLVVADELRVDVRYIQTQDFQAWSQPDGNIQAILQREEGSEEPYRLLSFMDAGQDVAPALHGIELAAGHHPNDLNRYRELIGMVGSSTPENLLYGPIRRLLNVKYILWPDFQYGAPPSEAILSRLQFADGRVYNSVIVENGLPRARLVGRAVIKTDEEAVPYMMSPGFDPETEVVLTEAPPIALDGQEANGTVRWLSRGPDRMTLSVTSDRPAMLVVADNWYQGWHATVDDVDAPVLRAYHTLRAIPIQAGEHTVELYYASASVARGLWVSLICLFLVVGAAALEFWRDRRREPSP